MPALPVHEFLLGLCRPCGHHPDQLSARRPCHGGRDTGGERQSSWRWFCSPEWEKWELVGLQAKPSALTNQLRIGGELHNWRRFLAQLLRSHSVVPLSVTGKGAAGCRCSTSGGVEGLREVQGCRGAAPSLCYAFLLSSLLCVLSFRPFLLMSPMKMHRHAYFS